MELLGTFSEGNFIPLPDWIDQMNGLDAKVNKVAEKLDQFLEGILKEYIERLNREADGDVSKKEERMKDLVDVLLKLQMDNSAGYSIKALIAVITPTPNIIVQGQVY